jgi:hypothetical protein
VQHPSRELLFFNVFSIYATVKIRPRPPHWEASKSKHTVPVGFLRTSNQLVAEDATYITHNKHNGQLSVPSAGFQPSISAINRVQTFALYRTATGIDSSKIKKKVKCTLVQTLRLCTFITTALEGGEGSGSCPAALYPRERPGTHCTGGWVGARAGLDGCGKSCPPPGFDPRTVQPVASRYTIFLRLLTNNYMTP